MWHYKPFGALFPLFDHIFLDATLHTGPEKSPLAISTFGWLLGENQAQQQLLDPP